MKFHWTVFILSHEDHRVKKFKITPLTVTSILFTCASLAVFAGSAGYGVRALRSEPTRLVMMKQENRQQAAQIARLSRDVAKLDKEMDALRRYNRRLSRLSRIHPMVPENLNGMGGGGADYNEQEGAASVLAEKMLNGEIREHIEALGNDIAIEQEVARELLAGIERQRSIIAHTPCVRPVIGWLTSHYGWRDSPFTGDREFHYGIDIASMGNAPVYAPADGIVASYSKSGSYGNVMVIDHGYGIVTRYGHLHEPAVRIGTPVRKGDTIAYVGNSGQSTGSHLHYEIIVNGGHVNPQRYMLK